MILIKLILSILFLIMFINVFKKAGKNLNITKLNMISVFFYFILFFNVIGTIIIFLGYRNHYLLYEIRYLSTINVTTIIVLFSVIMFPILLIFTRKLTKKYLCWDIDNVLNSKVEIKKSIVNTQIIILLLMAICTVSYLYVIRELGYFPLTKMIKGGSELAYLRQQAGRSFSGNFVIKNFIMLNILPFTAYLSYCYFRIIKTAFFRFTTIYLVILSMLALTYDFQKQPIIIHFLGLYMTEILLGRKINLKSVLKISGIVISLISFFYISVAGAGDQLFSVNSGPIGRVIFTHIAVLFLHVDIFPIRIGFLNGASFNDIFSIMIPEANNIRSSAVVMNVINSKGVESGTAGVMNTFFPGEAYANYGLVGALLSPIIFGLVMGILNSYYSSRNKTPLSIAMYVHITFMFITIIEGGFVDIFYSPNLWLMMLTTWILSKVID